MHFLLFKKNICPGQFYKNLVRHLLISKMTQGCYTHLDNTYVSFVCFVFLYMFCQCIVCLKDDFAFQFCVLCFFLYDIQHELRFSMLLMMIDLTARHYMVVKVKRPLLP